MIRGDLPLLQIRTRVLNGDLEGDFARWYPGLGDHDQLIELAA